MIKSWYKILWNSIINGDFEILGGEWGPDQNVHLLSYFEEILYE